MEKITTAKGRKFDTDMVSVLPDIGRAYIRVLNASIGDVAQTFGSPSETIQLWYNNIYLSGYTQLEAIIPENGAIRVNLRKE